MLGQVKVGLGFDLDVFAHHGVVGGQFFVDEGFVGDHFADSRVYLGIYGVGSDVDMPAGIEGEAV